MFRSIRTKRLRVNRSHLKCYPTFGSREDSSKLLLSSHTARPARSRERTVAIRETILSLKIYTIFLRFATALSHDLLLRSHISRPARPREKTVAICYCPLAHPDRPGSARELVQILSHAQTGSDLRAVIQMIMTVIFNFLIHLSHTQTGSDLRAVVQMIMTVILFISKFNTSSFAHPDRFGFAGAIHNLD